jgi:hypothetical protein
MLFARAYPRETQEMLSDTGALAHHAGEFRALDDEKGGAEHESQYVEDQEATWPPPFGGQCPETTGVAREQ